MKQVYDKSVEKFEEKFVTTGHFGEPRLTMFFVNNYSRSDDIPLGDEVLDHLKSFLKHHTLALIDAEIEHVKNSMQDNRGWVKNSDAHMKIQRKLKDNHLVGDLDTKVISQITAEAEDVFLDKALTDVLTHLKEQREIISKR